MIKYNISQIFSSPYNPNGNALSERINQQIAVILRIYRNTNLHTLKEKILTKLNFTVNRTTSFSPYEILNNKSALDPLQRTLKNVKQQVEERTKRNIESEQEKRNLKRKNHAYERGQLVYVRNMRGDKVADVWNGPYEVIEVLDRNRVRIDQINRVSDQNIKNLRPLKSRRGQDVV